MANSLLRNQFNQTLDYANNPYKYLEDMAKTNPQAQNVLNMMRNGASPESLARDIMKQKGINPDAFISFIRKMR